jgi:hypothetical protein
VILLVATGEFDHREELAGYRAERAGTAEAAEAALGRDGVGLVVYEGCLAAGADLAARLRGGEVVDGCLPFVVVTDGSAGDFPLLAVDEVVPPDAPEQLAAAVDRAHTVREYQRAVDELFGECRDRVGDADAPFEETPTLRAARDQADELLDDLVSDPATLEALLSAPERESGVAPPPGGRSGSDGE